MLIRTSCCPNIPCVCVCVCGGICFTARKRLIVSLWHMQAVSEEPLFRGTTVYLGAAIAAALKYVGDVTVNKGLQSDGEKFDDARPHAEGDGGYGNPVCRATSSLCCCNQVCVYRCNQC
jgi:hypothetical protein